MAIKVYISGICGSQDVRKQQQRVLFILSTLPLDLEIVDVTEPGREKDRTFMQEEAKKHNKEHVLPPQIFNNDEYCGDYDDFQLAADDDVLMTFLKLEEPSENVSNGHIEEPVITQNGISNSEPSLEPETEHTVSEEKVKEEDQLIGEGNITKSEEVVVNDNVESAPEAVKSDESKTEAKAAASSEEEESEEESESE